MNRRNYQRELEAVIKENESKSRVPRLLLHSCCAPCSSYVLEYLSDYFEITVFYYNPNISPAEEYEKRAAEQQHLIRELPAKHPIHLVVGAYEPERFYAVSRGSGTGAGGRGTLFSVLSPAPGGGGENGGRGRIRLLCHHPYHQSFKECPEAE